MNLISPPELSYITDSLIAGKRTDGRSLLNFREISLSTSVISQASGSSRVSCGGTDVLVGIKLETGDVDSEERLGISLEISQSALQNLPSDPTHSLLLHVHTLTSSLLSLPQLIILPQSKCWHLQLHITILSTSGGGNLHDILAIAVRSALYDLRIPRTRQVEFVRPNSESSLKREEGEDAGMKALLKGRKVGTDAGRSGKGAADFELIDYEADAGESLKGRDDLPLSITLNLIPKSQLPFLDATLFESFCVPTRLICTFDGEGNIRGIRQEIPDGSCSDEPNEIPYEQMDRLVDTAADLASKLIPSVNARLKDPATSKGGVRLGYYP